ncbi:MAG: hypothetical protein FWC16_00345 [Defluviitaleaceae bacterium]|nr:hypothetical protein [Defluviitaleaceae bacterium]MCL2273352.1 hypothetical protein [Defluviitaleaceae bacterium]
MNDPKIVLMFLIAIFIFIGLYFILDEGHPKRTKWILGLKKVDYKYKDNLISTYYGVLVIIYAGFIFLLLNLLFLGLVGRIIWVVGTGIYFFSARVITKKCVINNKRFMYC